MKKINLWAVAALALALAVFISCATAPELTPQGFWFQRLGKEGACTFTATDLSAADRFVVLDKSLREKITRISAMMDGQTYIALAEGNIPRSLFKTGMALSKDFSPVKGRSWYSDEEGNIKIGMPQNNLIIVTNGDYSEAEAFVMDVFSPVFIPDDTALMMADSDFAFYSHNPSFLPHFPIFSEDFTSRGIQEMLILLKENTLGLSAKFDTQQLKGAFNKLLKLNYIAKLKRSGIKVDIKALEKQFTEGETDLQAKDLYVSEEEKQKIYSSIKL